MVEVVVHGVARVVVHGVAVIVVVGIVVTAKELSGTSSRNGGGRNMVISLKSGQKCDQISADYRQCFKRN